MLTRSTKWSTSTLYLIVSFFFWVSLLGAILSIPVGVAGLFSSDHPYAVHATLPARELGRLPHGLKAAGGMPVQIPVDHPTTAQSLALLALLSIASGTIVFGLWLLRGVVRSVRDKDPFSPGNVRRLRILGLLFLAAYPVLQYLTAGINEWLIGGPPRHLTVHFDVLSGPAVLAGLCLLVLAEVFAHGVRLREDVEGTV